MKIASNSSPSSIGIVPPSGSKTWSTGARGGCTGVRLLRVATAGMGTARATRLAGATSSVSWVNGSPAVALTTTCSGRQVSSPSRPACARRSVTKTRSAASTTAWLSVATETESNRAARPAAVSALRGESTIAGGSATPSQSPVTMAEASAPTPSTPY